MSDYKFKVGDRVRILKMDGWSVDTMEDDIGKIGTIIDYNNDEGVNGYLIKISQFEYWYMEKSLEFVDKGDDKEMIRIRKDDVLSILYETKESGIFNYGTICDLIRRVRELPCK